MRVSKAKESRLEELLTACKQLDVEVRYNPGSNYFTAIVWNGWEQPAEEQAALAIQNKIQCMAGQISGLVCYCFDAFSTLVYEV